MFLFCFKQDKKLIKKVLVTLRVNYQGVLEFVSGSFEILPQECKKFENSLKLPRVLFSISLIIYTNNLQYHEYLYIQTLKTA